MDERLTQRDGQVWQAYLRSESQESIARRLGISQQRVSQIIADCRASVPAETREDQVTRAVELLAVLRSTAMELVDADPVPAYSNGRPVLLEDGRPAMDHGGRLAAFDRVLKVEERAARLLGLDAATKADLTVSGTEVAAAQAVAADAAARLARAREEQA